MRIASFDITRRPKHRRGRKGQEFDAEVVRLIHVQADALTAEEIIAAGDELQRLTDQAMKR